MNRRDVFSCLAAVLVTALSYHAVRSAGFVYDDLALIESNPSIRSFTNIGKWFTSSFWREVYNPADADQIPYYRPIVTIVLAIGNWISGLDPAGYHLLNLTIHCANTALIFKFARRYLSAFGAGVAAAAFGVHPAHVESVAWVSGISDVTATFFGILASLFIIACGDAMTAEGPRRKLQILLLWIASFLLSLAAFLTKESAIGIPLAVFVVEFFVVKQAAASNAKPSNWIRFLPYFAAAAAGLLYYYIRVQIFGPGAGFGLKQTEFYFPDWRYRSLRFELLKDYFSTAAYPFESNAFRTLRIDWTETSPEIRSAWLATLGIIAMYGAAALLALRYHFARAPLAFLLFFLIVTLPQIASPMSLGHFIFAERYLYIPVIGLALLLGWIFDVTSKKSVLAAFLIFIPILGAYAWKTLDRVPVWHDEFSLFSESEKASPDCATVKCALGRILLAEYQNTGNVAALDLAFEKFKAGIANSIRDRVYVSNHDVIQSYLGLASIQMIRGLHDAALSIFEQVALKFPKCEEAYNLAGVALSSIGNFDRAEENFKKALALRPTFANAYFNLGNLYINRGSLALAVQPLREAIRIEPTNAHAHVALATALFNLDQKSEAARVLAQYLETNPEGPGSDRVRAALAKFPK
ncbi:MAG: tetratricopeptide repeat protein [Planctomycetota bacterium]